MNWMIQLYLFWNCFYPEADHKFNRRCFPYPSYMEFMSTEIWLLNTCVGQKARNYVWARRQWDDASAVPQTHTHQYFQVSLTHLYPDWAERAIQQCCESVPQQWWWIDLFISKSQLSNLTVHAATESDPTTYVGCLLLSPAIPVVIYHIFAAVVSVGYFLF